MKKFIDEVMEDIQTAYRQEQRVAVQQGKPLPPEDRVMIGVRQIIEERVRP